MKPTLRVVAAIIEKDGKFLIGKRKKGKHLEGKWEFPGGKIENGESPQNCLERELKEEFGIITKAGEFIGENIVELEDRIINLLGYRGQYVSGDFLLNEHDEICWVSFDELNLYDFASADIPFLKKLKFQ